MGWWEGTEDPKGGVHPGESLVKPTSTRRAPTLRLLRQQPAPKGLPASTTSPGQGTGPISRPLLGAVVWQRGARPEPGRESEHPERRRARCQLAFASVLLQSKSGTCLKSKTN